MPHRRFNRQILVLDPAAGLIALGGCAAVSEDEYQAALDENRTLRQQVASLDDQLAACESDNRALVSNNETLSAQLASQPAPTASDSGFEGIEGSSIVRREGATALAIEGDLLFASGSVTLRPAAKAALDRVASVINSRYSGYTIRVEGYTDSDPIRKSDWKTNERLSSERALAVESYLVSRGVDADAIYSAAFGPSYPQSTKSQSRRVEIVVLAD